MRLVIVVGGGEVGFHLAERLSEETQDVVLIDSNAERAEDVGNRLDIMTVVGNGASLSVLEKAGIRKAKMVLAVTSVDEVNLIVSLAARRLGVEYVAARISSPEYYQRSSVLSGEALGIDLMINPELECARETLELIRSEVATDVASFADGRVRLIGLKVKEGARVAGKSLRQLGAELPDRHYVTAAIQRDGQTILPSGDDTIEVGDHVYLLSPEDELADVPRLAGYEPFKLQRVMIAGGSQEGLHIAELLEQIGVEATIIDRDRKRCLELAEALPKALILNGDATDLELLEMEGVAGMDVFVASTGNDDTNLLTSLLAKTVGARKVVTLIDDFSYLQLIPRLDVDASVSPRLSTVNAILRDVRGERITSVATLKGIDAEAIEFVVAEGSKIAGKRLGDVHFPHGGILGMLVRGEEVIVPQGDTEVRADDHAVVFALPTCIRDVEKLFA
jgi:trk system potassium uptake protein TrkA